MSILSDLDPKNARLPSAAENHNMAWLVAVLLLLGGTTWLYFGGPFKLARTPSLAEPTATASLRPLSDSAEPVQASVTPPGFSASGYTKPGPASIQSAETPASVARRTPSVPENAFQVPLKETAKTVRAKAPGSPGAPAASIVTSPAPQSKKHSTKHASAKAGTLRKTRNTRNASTQQPATGAAMASERDIEIISAIVR